jgi:DNA sulfur modification protein DndE
MKFKPSLASEEFIETTHERLGARTPAVLGRSALLLALGKGVPEGFEPADGEGKEMDDAAVTGDELGRVVREALDYRAGTTLDEPGYHDAFVVHFEYGCQRLSELWEESGRDEARFVGALLKLNGNGESCAATHVDPISVAQREVKLKVLVDAAEWSVNGARSSNALLLVSGKPGSGKTQLVLDLLAQLMRQGVRFIFFDMRGELEDNPNNPQQLRTRSQFLEQTGARYVRLIREGLPINPLYRDGNPTSNDQIAYEIASLVRCFAPQLGAKQERNICNAYRELAAPDFRSLSAALQKHGADGVEAAMIQKIDRFNLFADAASAVDPEEWLSSSLVIDFRQFGNDNDTKALSAALILNFLMKKLSRNTGTVQGIQPLKMVLFVDEAHLLLPKERKAGLLSSLARQGRSWGFPVWLASQDADKFLTTGNNETNFAELADCGVHFSPETLTDAEQRMILGGIIHTKLAKTEAAVRLQGKLFTGMARQYWKNAEG